MIALLALVVAIPAAATPPAPPPPPPEADTPAVQRAITGARACFTRRWEEAGAARVAAQDAVRAMTGPAGSATWLTVREAVRSLVRARVALARCADLLSVEQATAADLDALSYWRRSIWLNVQSQGPYELSILRAFAGYRDELAW